LTAEAEETLGSENGPEKFRGKYGDFYLAELGLGGDAGVYVTTSASSSASSEDISVVAEVNVLFFSDDVEVARSHEAQLSRSAEFALVAHDTVDKKSIVQKWSGWETAKANDAQNKALEYSRKTDGLDGRVREALSDVKPGKVSQEDCEKLWKAGVIAEMLFVPFRTLRQVKAFVTDDTGTWVETARRELAVR
jgi:hypothetical protein